MYGKTERMSRRAVVWVLILTMLLAMLPGMGLVSSAAEDDEEKVAWVDFSTGEAKNMVAQFGKFDGTEGLVTLDEYGQVGKTSTLLSCRWITM